MGNDHTPANILEECLLRNLLDSPPSIVLRKPATAGLIYRRCSSNRPSTQTRAVSEIRAAIKSGDIKKVRFSWRIAISLIKCSLAVKTTTPPKARQPRANH